MFVTVDLFRSVSVSALFALIFFAGSFQANAQKKSEAPAKLGTVSVCKEIDDDWKCVGESTTWEANKKFNVLFINPDPMKGEFIGIIFHKQLPDGKDGDFLYEFQQNIGSGNRKYATTEAPFYLPVGVYTIYIVAWDKRDSLYHKGNFTDHFAKMTLTVK